MSDLQFLYQHAYDYIAPYHGDEAGHAYARWYLEQFGEDGLESAPGHTSVWLRWFEEYDAA